MGSDIVLFTRPDCDLCREVNTLLQAHGHEPELRDITLDAALMRSHGHRVPVLQDATGRELAFPFDQQMLNDWLEDLP